jgi:cytochrome c
MKNIVKSLIFSLLLLLASCGQLSQPSKNTASPNTDRESPTPPPANTALPKSPGERGTPDEAKAMMMQAVEHYSQVGRERALKDFNGKTPPFADRDLYVACIDNNHKLVANGGYPSLVGTSTDAWKDADGNQLGKSIADAMSPEGEAIIKYRWYNPLSKKIEPKTGFFHKVGTDICGVGAYSP